MLGIIADLHQHIWSDHHNSCETKKLAFSLDGVVDAELGSCLDAVGVVDIMANWPGEKEFRGRRYVDLLDTAKEDGKYVFDKREGYSVIYDGEGKPVLHLIRTQEVLIEHLKHLLAIGLDVDIMPKRNSVGKADTEEILKEIQGEGGYAIPAHPGFRSAWEENELWDFYDSGLIQAIEGINEKLSLPGLRRCNKWALQVEAVCGIPAIENSDLSYVNDLLKHRVGGTVYFAAETGNIIKDIFNAIAIEGTRLNEQKGKREKGFERVGQYASRLSLPIHAWHGFLSQRRNDKYSLPDA